MKFSGELKFPEIDHPGVPVQFLIEGTQAELIVEGESLGRWSLYDIHARRLIASAFLIDLEGTEVTFVADDPIDFAYRGVEHMAETWAAMKSRRIARRTVAVRKSRRGIVPSRIADLRSAMEANLDEQAPRPTAGEPGTGQPGLAGASAPALAPAPETLSDWDRRDAGPGIPMVGREQAPALEPDAASVDADEADTAETPLPSMPPALTEAQREIEEEKRRIAEERERLEQERIAAGQREANLLEAYRLEMLRLEAERDEVRKLAAAAEKAALEAAGAPVAGTPLEEVPGEGEPDGEEAEEVDEPAAFEPAAFEPAAFEPAPSDEPTAPEEAPPPPRVLDLNDYEVERARLPLGDADAPAEEPVLAGVSKDKGGLMGAVKAAFRTGPKDHDHRFLEAPGGLGITRYVCEDCGYVSISVGD